MSVRAAELLSLGASYLWAPGLCTEGARPQVWHTGWGRIDSPDEQMGVFSLRCVCY